jgi:endonuclease/exonuclease/phosphatase family metal-dependent hydrolase
MRIITWNANRVDRWTQLWNDNLVSGLAWDVICLQEAGNPDAANWNHVSGPVWDPNVAQRDTDESFMLRRYTYQPPNYNTTFHILHIEWAKRQKNHLVIITKTHASWGAELGGDMSDRPAMGIKARLVWPTATRDILIGCVHIVANATRSPQEISAMVPYINAMCQAANAQGWLLVGDMNCPPGKLMNEATEKLGVWYPQGATQQSVAEPIDYLVVDPGLYEVVMATPNIDGLWERGSARSDHVLLRYTQINGPTLQIL